MSRAAPATAEPAAEAAPPPTFAEQVEQLRARFSAETDPFVRAALGERLMQLETELGRVVQRQGQYAAFQLGEQRKREHEELRRAKWRQLDPIVRALHIAVVQIRREADERRQQPGEDVTPGRAVRIVAEAALQPWDDVEPPDFFMPNPFNNA